MLARGRATTANRPERAFPTSTCVETRRRGYPKSRQAVGAGRPRLDRAIGSASDRACAQEYLAITVGARLVVHPQHHRLAGIEPTGILAKLRTRGILATVTDPSRRLPSVRSSPSRQARFAAIACCAAAISPLAHGGLLWSEQLNGDFADHHLSPTALVLSPGQSEINGRIEDGGGGAHLDLDYFSLTIPAGHRLESMVLLTYLSPDAAAFLAIQPGPIFPQSPDDITGGDQLMGWVHFGPSYLSLDLLPFMAANGFGFTPPLPSGTFSFWAQQTDDLTEYTLLLDVQPIPAPPAFLAGAVLTLAAVRRRRTIPGR